MPKRFKVPSGSDVENGSESQRGSGAEPDFAVLTVNQLVAYNLMRARRRAGWTQAEAAQRLNVFGGRRYTAATLSAAERSWESGRSREFDASELLAFSLVFDEPVSFFFIPMQNPDEMKEWRYSMKVGSSESVALSAEDVIDHVVPLRFSASFVDDVNAVLRRRNISWYPSTHLDWYDPSEDADPSGSAPEGGLVDPESGEREASGESARDGRSAPLFGRTEGSPEFKYPRAKGEDVVVYGVGGVWKNLWINC
ncbi:helix-turn-helix transcriptional regulator [Streptomyces scabiei]|uniref:helix-turn-helix transcriptional regulator n=1 Tax=Streptomyces scabiei TaxID=1930 RepID=UPI001B317DAB|nr:helix-turn-helix transcriptional regulator [Streptomyces sp. LBUM 1482]QTU47636.1 helix-turn-helix transcriptional regulator [Streptomyces sp. LBUM 1482]